MGEMRDSDWSRPNLLRSDWLGLIVATMTTDVNLCAKEGGKEKTGERALFLSSFSSHCPLRLVSSPVIRVSHSLFVRPKCKNLGLRSTLSKTDTFGTGNKCPS